jgi:DNA-3-methyladenine glycosylase II
MISAGGDGLTIRFTLTPKRPYSLALTAERYTRFPEVVDRFSDGVYRRLLPVGRGVLVSIAQAGPPSAARLEVRLDGRLAGSPAARQAAVRLAEVSLGAASDVAGFYRAHAGDPVLGAPIRAYRGLRIAGVPSLWEALVTAVLAQQVNLMFAYDIRRELALRYGPRARFFGETYVGFPPTAPLADETLPRLRRFRLSRSKAVAIRGLARAFEDGSLSERELASLPDEEAIARLTELPGVGRWTAEIALMRGLGRPDIFPAGDLGVVKYLAQGLLGHSTRAKEDEMRTFAQRWTPHRSLALVYGYAELTRRKAALSPRSIPPRRPPDPGSAPSRRR